MVLVSWSSEGPHPPFHDDRVAALLNQAHREAVVREHAGSVDHLWYDALDTEEERALRSALATLIGYPPQQVNHVKPQITNLMLVRWETASDHQPFRDRAVERLLNLAVARDVVREWDHGDAGLWYNARRGEAEQALRARLVELVGLDPVEVNVDASPPGARPPWVRPPDDEEQR